MARMGLFFGLQELIRPGQTVVMSPLTIVDVVNMVILAGGIPVFADIRRQSCAVDPNQLESLIDNNTGAVLITHLHGESAGAHDFYDICRRHGVPLIEDAAQAFGAIENGSRLGTIGDLGIYSFGFYKNLNAWRGGVVVSQEQSLITRIRRRMERLPTFPMRHLAATAMKGLLTDLATWPPLFAAVTHRVFRESYLRDIKLVNRQLDPEEGALRLSEIPTYYLGRMTPAQAIIALKQLDRIDADTLVRIRHAGVYNKALSQIEEIITPKWQDTSSNIYTYYPVQFGERDSLLGFAMCQKRDFAAQYLRNCADLKQFREFYRDCPNARAAARELILLPTYPAYPLSEIQRNIETIQRFFSMRATQRLQKAGPSGL
jgi:perosamine synthetase